MRATAEKTAITIRSIGRSGPDTRNEREEGGYGGVMEGTRKEPAGTRGGLNGAERGLNESASQPAYAEL